MKTKTFTIVFNNEDEPEMVVTDVVRDYLGPEGVALCLTKSDDTHVIINFSRIKYYIAK